MSIAEQLTLLLPTVAVFGVPQLDVATPESASVALGVAVAVPLSSTALGATAGASDGAVASRLIVTVSEPVPPALVALHVTAWPGVSALMIVDAHGTDVTADSASFTDQLTVTLPLYQPLLPNAPLMFGVMTGGVSSTDGSASYAPMSQLARCGRATPRWSCAAQESPSRRVDRRTPRAECHGGRGTGRVEGQRSELRVTRGDRRDPLTRGRQGVDEVAAAIGDRRSPEAATLTVISGVAGHDRVHQHDVRPVGERVDAAVRARTVPRDRHVDEHRVARSLCRSRRRAARCCPRW